MILREALWWASVVAPMGPPEGWEFVLWLLIPPLPQAGPQGIRRDLAKGGEGASSRPEGEGGMFESFTLSVDRGLVGLSEYQGHLGDVRWSLFTDATP